MSRRAVPSVGTPVTVIELDARTRATIVEVHDEGRRVVVDTEDGMQLTFTLRGATAVFTAEPGSAWPRLVFDG